MKVALVAFAAVLLLVVLLVLRRREAEVIAPEWSEPAIDNRPMPMVIEPEWSEPSIDSRHTTVVAEPVMQATKSPPGWLSRNKYKVGLGGLMLLSVLRKQSNWQSIPWPSFSNFKPELERTLYPAYYNHFGPNTHFAPAYDLTARELSMYDDADDAFDGLDYHDAETGFG